MKVRNLNGTTPYRCRCGSWLNHWKRFSGRQQANICRAKGCSNYATVGAHVQKYGYYDFSWYIVPFCYTHNMASSSIELINGTTLVSANKSLTCG